MKALAVSAVVFFAFLLLFPAADAALIRGEPRVIPERLSVNESFIFLAELDTNDSARVNWNAKDFSAAVGEFAAGLLPKMGGNRYYCYFSGGNDSNCGPSPFISSAAKENNRINFTVTDNSMRVTSRNISFGVGEINFVTRVVADESNRLIMNVFTRGLPVDRVDYRIYDRNIYEKMSGSLKPEPLDPSRHTLDRNITLLAGEYFISLEGSSAESFGGTVVKILVGERPQQPLDYLPLRADKVSFQTIVEPGKQSTARTNYRLINDGNSTISNLSVRIPDPYRDMLIIGLDSTTLPAGGELYFSVAVKNINARTDINARVPLYAGGREVGKIDVEIDAGVTEAAPVQADSLALMELPVWKESLLAGEAAKTFTLVNSGDRPLENISFTTSPKELADITQITPVASLPSRGNALFTVTVSSAFAGEKTGIITADSKGGKRDILVDLRFFEDRSQEILAGKARIESVKKSMGGGAAKYSDIIKQTEAAFDSAKADFDASRYESFEARLSTAAALLGALESLPSSTSTTIPPPDENGGKDDGDGQTPVFSVNPIYIIIIAVAIGAAGVAAFFVVKKKRQQQWEEEGEEVY